MSTRMHFRKKLPIFAAVIVSFQTFLSAKAAETFVYSGGCFWCTEADFESVSGVSEVISGFTGGTTPSPRYQPGKWGDHREAAQIIYDSALISFDDLVNHVYATIDYEDSGGQFCDRGHSYSPAIYYQTDEEREIIERLAPTNSVVPIEPETAFYPVREEQQDYYKKQAFRYKYYRFRCGRDSRLEELNGDR